MDAQVEKQAQFVVEAVRAARSQPDRPGHEVFLRLVEQVKAAATGATLRERRAFVGAVGKRLQEQAGPSREVKPKALAGKLRIWDSPDGQSLHDIGELLIRIAKAR